MQCVPPESRFRTDLLFQRLFSNETVARWLLSKDQFPPTSLTPSMMQHSVAVNSLLTTDSNTASILLNRERAQEYREIEGDGVRPRKDPSTCAPSAIVEEGEKLTIVCHADGDQYAFVSVTDDRTPLAFIEKPAPTVPGIRHGVCMKLDDMYALVCYIWLQNGLSSMTICYYTFQPALYSEKCFLLLGKYPDCRFPKVSDILETLTAIEEPMCQYCVSRGFPACVCPSKLYQRTLPSLPAEDQRTGWDLYSYSWSQLEPGLKKYTAFLTNHLHNNMTIVVPAFHQATPIYNNPATRMQGFRHYVDTIASYVNSKIGYDYSRLVLLHDDESEHKRAKRRRRDPDPSPSPQNLAINIQIPTDVVANAHIGYDIDVSVKFSSFKRVEHVSISNSHAVIEGAYKDSPLMNADTALAPSVPLSREQEAFRRYLQQIEAMPWPSPGREPCKFCPGKLFNRRHDLKRHVRSIHMDETEYDCGVCGRQFKRKSHLDAHFASVHEQKLNHICQLCLKGFPTNVLRRKHVLRVHKVQESSIKDESNRLE